MIAVAEDPRAMPRVVGPFALEDAGAVVQAVGQDVDLGLIPGDDLSVVPDQLHLFHARLLKDAVGPPGWPQRYRLDPPDLMCAAPRPARYRRPILPPPPGPPARTRGAASERPRGSWPADWPPRCRRYRALNRGQVRTRPGRHPPATRSAAFRSIRSASPPRRSGCHRTYCP